MRARTSPLQGSSLVGTSLVFKTLTGVQTSPGGLPVGRKEAEPDNFGGKLPTFLMISMTKALTARQFTSGGQNIMLTALRGSIDSCTEYEEG